MKILFAILSCHPLRNYEQAQRDTWVKDIPAGVDYKFFLGFSPHFVLDFDEVYLNAGDTFSDITEKSVEMSKWALEHGYDFMVKADLDTFMRPAALLQSLHPWQDYVGGENHQGISFASGGAGYILSRRALQIMADTPFTEGPAEDLHVARALLGHGIELYADPRFKFVPGARLEPQDLTYHLSSVVDWAAKYKPEWMYEAYRSTSSYAPPAAPKAAAPEPRFRRLRRL